MQKTTSLILAVLLTTAVAGAHPSGGSHGGGGSSRGGGGSSHSSSSGGGGFHGGGGGFHGGGGGFHGNDGFHGNNTSGQSSFRSQPMPSLSGHAVRSMPTFAPTLGTMRPNLGTPRPGLVNPGIHLATLPPPNAGLLSPGRTVIPSVVQAPRSQVVFVQPAFNNVIVRPFLYEPVGFFNPFFNSACGFYSGFAFGNGFYRPYSYYNPLAIGFFGNYGYGSGYLYGDSYGFDNGGNYGNYNNNGYDNSYGNTSPADLPNNPAPDSSVQGQEIDGRITRLTDTQMDLQVMRGTRSFLITPQTRVSQILVKGDYVRLLYAPGSGYQPEALEILKADSPGTVRGNPSLP